MSFAVVCSGLRVEWADGTVAFTDLELALSPGRTGLVGRNGSGKSTLLRLIAGELRPTSGTVRVVGTVGYLPQVLDRHRGTVAQLMGLGPVLDALGRIERGVADPEAFDIVGQDWDVEERAAAALAAVGVSLPGPRPLRRSTQLLSGGELIQTAIAGCLLRRPDILLLDEPTNNLDRAARERLYDLVSSWTGVLVVVSHDRELLDLMDSTVELHDGTARTHGGNWTDFQRTLELEQQAAERRLHAADSDVKREKQQLAQARILLDRRARYGQKMYDQKREPRIAMQARKMQAQESAGKLTLGQLSRVEGARDAANRAADAVRDDPRIRIQLPGTAVPAGRTMLELIRRGALISVEGPERIALIGASGAGKTTLLRQIVGEIQGIDTRVRRVAGPVGYLPQRLDLLDDQLSVLDNLRDLLPRASPHQVRAQLARFLILGDRVDQPAGTLSGGEQFRATLAMLLLADPPPQLLLLDEPTNNLDLDSVSQLESALSGYGGVLIVASHDLRFVESVAVQRFWDLDARGALTDTAV